MQPVKERLYELIVIMLCCKSRFPFERKNTIWEAYWIHYIGLVDILSFQMFHQEK